MDYVLAKEEFDIVEDFSAQITTAMITTVLGLPSEDWPQIRDWTTVMALNNGSTTWMKELEAERIEENLKVAQALNDYFHDYLAERKKNPREGDIVSILISSEVGGVRFTEEEIQSMVMLLLIAGNETRPISNDS
jgi:cytochrome P450